jgi:hypothetical protein
MSSMSSRHARLSFSITLIIGLIFTDQTTLARDVHPGLAFCTLWISVLVAHDGGGSQGSLVGCSPSTESFQGYPSLSPTSAVKLPTRATIRYLLGRQFMVVVMVFTINISGGPIADATLGIP